jgi:hypothetical protein
MKNRLLTLAATTAVLLGLTASASAQATPAQTKPAVAATTTTTPTFELSAGYQFLRTGQVCDDSAITQTCAADRSYPFGLAVDAVRNFGALGIVGEGGWSYDSDSETLGGSALDFKVNSWHLAGGGRYTSRRSPKLWPYGQFLVGMVQDHLSGDAVDFISGGSVTHTSFMLQPGVGVNYVLGDGWGIVGAIDYRRVFLSQDSNSSDPLRNLSGGRNDFRLFIGFRMILD